jgi:hypothetical protein
MDEDEYKEGDALCPSFDKQSNPAALCLPAIQYDEDTSKTGDEEGSYIDDDEQCCCGCGQDASGSHHYYLHSMKRVLLSCCHPDQEVSEEDGNLPTILQQSGTWKRKI